jgi:hypothetical protein
MFANGDDVVNTAFISFVEPGTIKDNIILNAELTYIKPSLTAPLYQVVVNDPGHYSELIDTYIKPCLCYYVKYLVYNSLFVEKAGGSGLIDGTYSVTNNTEIRQETIQDIFKIAKNFETLMVAYVIEQGYPEYTPPEPPVDPPDPPPPDTGRLKCGFYI